MSSLVNIPLFMWRKFKRRILLNLTAIHRKRLSGTDFVGITGSCAKTTVKTLLAEIVAGSFSVSQNPGTQNRDGAMAKTVLKTAGKNGICVQEFGADGPGSLDAMIDLYKPTVAVITNILGDHFSAFRTLEATAAEKSKLVAALPPSGTAVLNTDDPLVIAMAKKTMAKIVTYGECGSADLRSTGFDYAWPGYLKGCIVWKEKEYPVETCLIGDHWAPAVLAAIATALALNLDMELILDRLRLIKPAEGRLSTVCLPNNITYICDHIKAPIHTVAPALAVLEKARAQRKIAVIGNISDYPGSTSPKYRRIAKQALMVADIVILLGKWAQSGLKGQPADIVGKRLLGFRHLAELNTFLQPFLQSGDLVLLKGSIKTDHMERLIMARSDHVSCWQTECGRSVDCRQCSRRRTRCNPISDRSEETKTNVSGSTRHCR